jgi:hypothetical protein
MGKITLNNSECPVHQSALDTCVTTAWLVELEQSLHVQRGYLQFNVKNISQSFRNLLAFQLKNSEAFVGEVKRKLCARDRLMIGHFLTERMRKSVRIIYYKNILYVNKGLSENIHHNYFFSW